MAHRTPHLRCSCSGPMAHRTAKAFGLLELLSFRQSLLAPIGAHAPALWPIAPRTFGAHAPFLRNVATRTCGAHAPFLRNVATRTCGAHAPFLRNVATRTCGEVVPPPARGGQCMAIGGALTGALEKVEGAADLRYILIGTPVSRVSIIRGQDVETAFQWVSPRGGGVGRGCPPPGKSIPGCPRRLKGAHVHNPGTEKRRSPEANRPGSPGEKGTCRITPAGGRRTGRPLPPCPRRSLRAGPCRREPPGHTPSGPPGRCGRA